MNIITINNCTIAILRQWKTILVLHDGCCMLAASGSARFCIRSILTA